MEKTSLEMWDRVEEEILLLLNRRLLENDMISKTLYERAQFAIVSMGKKDQLNG